MAIKMNRLALEHDAKHLGKRLPNTDRPAAKRLSNLDIPVLVVVGENDIPYIQAASDYMIEKIPLARKITVKDAAHLPNMEHPAEFQSALRKFFNETTK